MEDEHNVRNCLHAEVNAQRQTSSRRGGTCCNRYYNYVFMLHHFRDIVDYFPKIKEVTW